MQDLLKAIIERVKSTGGFVSNHSIEAAELLRRVDHRWATAIDAVGLLLDRIAELEAEAERLREIGREARGILKAATAQHTDNDNADQIAALNAGACDAICVLEGMEAKP